MQSAAQVGDTRLKHQGETSPPKSRAWSSQRVKRLTRLSGRASAGLLVAMLGRWGLLLPTVPLMSAASVVKCLAMLPVGWPGYHCVKASRMARYLLRLSLIVGSCRIGRAFQQEYTMRPPLTTSNSILQDYLAPVSGSGTFRDRALCSSLRKG